MQTLVCPGLSPCRSALGRGKERREKLDLLRCSASGRGASPGPKAAHSRHFRAVFPLAGAQFPDGSGWGQWCRESLEMASSQRSVSFGIGWVVGEQQRELRGKAAEKPESQAEEHGQPLESPWKVTVIGRE